MSLVPAGQRVVVRLDHALRKHIQHHLRVFRVVFIPRAVAGFSQPGECDRRDGAYLEALHEQTVSQRAMKIRRRLESGTYCAGQALEIVDKPMMVGSIVCYLELRRAPLASWTSTT